MPAAREKSTAESFLSSVFQYSISTFVNMGIMGLSIVLTGLFISDDVYGQIGLFNNWTNTIMTIAILGLDQSLIRFYHEPPAGLSKNGLFRVCFYCSGAVVVGFGAVCSTLLLGPIYRGIGFSAVGGWVVPLLFLNALFYMVARYFNVLYRMEGNIRVYTAESILMQFFYKLFYILGSFLGADNPVAAMAICSAAGLGGFALVFSFLRRSALHPRRQEFSPKAYKTVLPYGLAVAPTAVMVTMNFSLSQSLIRHMMGSAAAGTYGFGYTLSNIVTMVQGGFASFWGPYMFAHYKTEQARIKRVHDCLNLVILCFFSLLVAFQDIIFLLFPNYAAVAPIFPLMMLSAVFTILCETTVYGNAIARRPIYDTIGIGLSFACNILFVLLLVPRFGLYGAAVAIALANLAMFLFRTGTGQRLYSSIPSPAKTAAAVALAMALAAAGTALAGRFWPKLACSLAAILLYLLLYRRQFVTLAGLGLSMLKGLWRRRP